MGFDEICGIVLTIFTVLIWASAFICMTLDGPVESPYQHLIRPKKKKKR